MRTPGLSVFFFLMFAGLCGALWWHLAASKRPMPSDFVVIDGTVEDYRENITSHRGGKSGRLDISLAGRGEAFAVANNDYLKNFRREHFFESVPKGSAVRLTVERENLDRPGVHGMSGGRPNVWVWGLEGGGQVYYALEDALNWQAANLRNGMIIATVLTVVLLCCLWVSTDNRIARAKKRREVIT
jgi:hypothetical protein